MFYNLHIGMSSSHNSKLHFNELSFYFKSLCICDVNSGYLHTKQTENLQDKLSQCAIILLFFSTAFLRRGMGYKALKQYELAMENFKSMLKIDPNNKRAKVLLQFKQKF